MGILQGLKRTAASVPNAEPGYVMFFIDENGRPKYKDELGVVGDYLGFKGYAPIYSTVVSGDLVFLRVTDWDGGEGAKPATGQYVSSSGLVLDINLATNFRGPQGIQGIQGIQGFKGWGPVLSVISDVDRRVFQVADWVGGEGAKPATGAYLGATGFVFDLPSAIDVRGPQGLIGPSPNAFSTFSTPSGTSPVADQSNDTLTFLNGTGISISGNASADEITITNTDTGSSAVTTHEAAVDPHPQYLTAAEGNAAYQPVDAELTAVAGLTTNGLITKTSAGAATTRTITQGTGITVVNGDGVSGNPTITNSDTGSSAVSSHVAAGDPHTQYAQNSFSTISTPSGTSPAADSRSDTLNLTATGGTTITGDASTDTITIGSVALTSSAPSNLGASPSVGVATTSARADHVHQFPTPGDIGAQPVDSDLTAIAGLAGNGIIARTGTGTATTRAITSGTGISVANGDGVAGNPTITNTDLGSTAVATHEAAGDPHPQYLTSAEGNAAYQPLDTDLTAVAGLASNGLISRTGSGTAAVRTISGGTGISVANGDGVAGNPTITNSDTGSSAVSTHVAAGDPHTQYAQNSFSTISTPAGTSPVADSRADTLNLAAGGGTTITGDATTDTVTISSPALSSTTPSSLGVAAAVGVGTTSARADHVHPFPTATDVGAQPVDSDLTAIAGLATNGLIARTGAGAAATRSVAAGTGISVSNGDGVAGNPTVTNTDTGSAAVATHEAAGDPHPQYLTTAEGDAAYQPLDADLTALAGISTNGILVHTGAGTATSRSIAAGYGVTVTNGDGVAGNPTVAAQTRFVSKFLTSVQPVSVLTPTLLTGHQIVLAPGERCSINAVLAATAAAATTGIGYSINVAQGAGANANAIGSAYTNVSLTSAAAATPFQDGDVFNVAAGANATFEVLGTATVAGNNGAHLSAVVWNQSTNANTTIEIRMRSEVNGSAVTAQIGTGFTATIGLT